MQEFLEFYNSIYRSYGFNLEIYHSSIMDWVITIGYKYTNSKRGQNVIRVSGNDMNLVFAKAQVSLKEWLLKNKGGY